MMFNYEPGYGCATNHGEQQETQETPTPQTITDMMSFGSTIQATNILLRSLDVCSSLLFVGLLYLALLAAHLNLLRNHNQIRSTRL